MMEEIVQELAELQEELNDTRSEAAKDERVVRLRATADDAAKQLDAAKIELSNEMIYYEATYERLDMEIDEISAQIIKAWDGEKKTLKFGDKTLKFRTTQSLKINDAGMMLVDLIEHLTPAEIADKYIKGFKSTPLKKYISVISIDTDVVELIPKTTVKLDVV